MIHENKIIFIVECLLERFLTTLCGIGFDKRIPEKLGFYKEICGIIVNYEHFCVACGKLLSVLPSESLIPSLFEIEFSDFFTCSFSLRNLYNKS